MAGPTASGHAGLAVHYGRIGLCGAVARIGHAARSVSRCRSKMLTGQFKVPAMRSSRRGGADRVPLSMPDM